MNTTPFASIDLDTLSTVSGGNDTVDIADCATQTKTTFKECMQGKQDNGVCNLIDRFAPTAVSSFLCGPIGGKKKDPEPTPTPGKP